MTNSEAYPAAWAVFVDCARDIENTSEASKGKYCIPNPSKKDEMIYADDPLDLFNRFRDAYYTPSFDAIGVYGKIQYIVEHF